MENKTNSGALFQNNKKQNDRSPDFRGNANIGGCEMWLSGWQKTSKNGVPWISLSFSPKEPQTQNKEQPLPVKSIQEPKNSMEGFPPEPEPMTDPSLPF